MANKSDTGILVLGGTGKTGGRVVRQLREKGVSVRVGSRNGTPRFDWGDPDTWASALEGVDAVYVIDRRAEVGQEAIRELEAFVRAASDAGVRRLVHLSSRAAEVGGEDPLALTEGVIKRSGMEWTIVRASWFAQNFSEWDFFTRQIAAGEVVLSTGDGRQPFVDVEDIAAVAVAALTEGGHHGQTYDVTGPRALSFGDAAAEIAKATGRPVTYRPLSGADYREYLIARGQEGPLGVADLFGYIARGETAEVSDDVRRVLGREPRDFADFVRTAAAEDAWT